jgi:predicted Zn-dependent protease
VLGYTPASKWSAYDRVFDGVIRSFDELTARQYLDVQPRRVDIVDIGQPMTVANFASRYPSTVSPDVLALINGVPNGGTLPGGQPAKTVVGGRLPGTER